jgi:glycine/D-amino acid oxidase-like deaminating enzyme
MPRRSNMKSDSGDTISLWMATFDLPSFPKLDTDLATDVCIVGAGISGLTTAYLLAREGKSVVVLDDGPVAGGETGRTTAHLTAALDDFYHEIEKMHGEGGARIAAESHMASINRIEQIVAAEQIDCDFARVDGYYFLAGNDTVQLLDDEYAAAHRAGIVDVQRLERIPGVPFDSGPALRFPRQAQFHILKYIGGLTRAITRLGGRIFCDSHVEGLTKRPRRPQVKTKDKKTVTADAIVFATNSPVNDWVVMHTKQAPYRTYVIAGRVPAGAIATGLYWDTADPYHYVRLYRGEHAKQGGDARDWLIVGGEDHKTGQSDDADARFRSLEQWARQRFPMIESIDHRWSGQVMEPVDYMGFIGRNPGDENIYIATGDSGNGMTHGTIAGMLITDQILGKDNPWSTLYDPGRKSLRAAGDFLKENLNVAAQYADYLTPSAESRAPYGRPIPGMTIFV